MIRHPHAKTSADYFKQFLPWFVILACILGLYAFLAFLQINSDQNFWFVPHPPVPTYAINSQHYEGSLPGSRTITFETAQPAEKVRQFYREELPKHGWYLLCSPTQLEQPGCPLGLSPSNELADAYKRNDEPSMYRAIDVTIYKRGENLVDSQNRLVEVIEYRYPLPTP